jgi:hypothetical protein
MTTGKSKALQELPGAALCGPGLRLDVPQKTGCTLDKEKRNSAKNKLKD